MPCYRDQQQLDKDIVPKLLPSIAGHCCFQDKETSLIQRGPTRLASASPSGRGVTEGDGEGYTTKHHSGVVMSRFQHPRPADRLQVSEIHYLPYHTLGMNKYQLLSQPYTAPDKPLDAPELLAFAQDYAQSKGLTAILRG